MRNYERTPTDDDSNGPKAPLWHRFFMTVRHIVIGVAILAVIFVIGAAVLSLSFWELKGCWYLFLTVCRKIPWP